jgi:hypothetical protein
MQDASMEQQLAAPTGPIRGQAQGLVGVKGRLLVTVGGTPLGVLYVDGSEVEFAPGDGKAEAAVSFKDRADLVHMLRGELNPVVALLQERMSAEGDAALAAKIILGLRAGSSFRGERLTQEG